MNRRELLKAAGGIFVANRLAEMAFDLRPSGGFIVFYDPKLLRDNYADNAKERGNFPPNTVFCAVDVPPDKTLDDAIRIFRES